jgi:predicted DNA-binding transcriptional regulator AlpA
MRAERAAAYLDMSVSKFKQLVEDGRMPRPVRIDGGVTWDRLELDAAYDEFKDTDLAQFDSFALLFEIADMSTSELERALERETNPEKLPYYQNEIANRARSDPGKPVPRRRRTTPT